MCRVFFVFLFFGFFVFMGCSANITRYGYKAQDVSSVDKNFSCPIPIKKDFVYNKEDVEVLGEIMSGDSGFSMKCSKSDALNIFTREACALKADLINIVYERDMDIWSSCYRAKAQFLRFKDKEKAKNLESDLSYRR